MARHISDDWQSLSSPPSDLRSLSDIDLSIAANDPQPSASFSARKNPQCIPANTPPVFPGLRPRIWSHLLRLVTKVMSDRLLACAQAKRARPAGKARSEAQKTSNFGPRTLAGLVLPACLARHANRAPHDDFIIIDWRSPRHLIECAPAEPRACSEEQIDGGRSRRFHGQCGLRRPG